MKIKFTKQAVFILILILTSLFLRFYKLDSVPASLYYDEVDLGYQARSLIETGKDYRDNLNPFFVHSFHDQRTPIPVYLTILGTLVFPTPELQVRGPFALLGVGVVILIFWLIKLWIKNINLAFLIALIFVFNPWQIQFSRVSLEVMSMLFFYLLALVIFYKWLQSKRFNRLLLATILLSLTVYTYRTMSFYIPITLVVLGLIYRQDLWRHGVKRLAIIILVVVVIMGLFLYATTVKSLDTPRAKLVAITSDPTIPIWIQRNREVDSGDYQIHTLGKTAIFSAYIFHSKLVAWIDAFASSYVNSFSSEFLILRGDPNLRHGIGQMGEIYFLDFVALIFGLFYLFKNFKLAENKFLLAWFLTAPIPASLTIDGASHGGRLFIFSAPLLVIIGFGWWLIFKNLSALKWGKLILTGAGVIYGLLIIFYLHRLFIHYPIESARAFGFGFKQVMSKIVSIESQYQKVIMVPTNDPPMIYYLFWSKTLPRLVQQYGPQFSSEISKGQSLDKYKVTSWSPADGMKDNTLYLVTQREVGLDLRNPQNIPEGMKLVDLISYPDNEVAFYLISKKPAK